jgi:hypothetical protein
MSKNNMKHVIICLLNGIAILTMTTTSLAQDTETYVGATAEPGTTATVPATKLVDSGLPPPRTKADKLIISGAILTPVGGLLAVIGGAVFAAGENGGVFGLSGRF